MAAKEERKEEIKEEINEEINEENEEINEEINEENEEIKEERKEEINEENEEINEEKQQNKFIVNKDFSSIDEKSLSDKSKFKIEKYGKNFYILDNEWLLRSLYTSKLRKNRKKIRAIWDMIK